MNEGFNWASTLVSTEGLQEAQAVPSPPLDLSVLVWSLWQQRHTQHIRSLFPAGVK